MANYPITTHAYQAPRDSHPVALCIGGSDSAGLAGIQMDCRSCESMGVHAATAITATTAQNNDGLYSLNPVAVDVLQAQIEAALDLQPAVIKIGLLGSAGQIDLLASILPKTGIPIVLDTVLATSSDGAVLGAEARSVLLEKLVPMATVLTPNLPETAALLDRTARSATDIESAAAALRGRGADWVVIKGGHGDSDTVSDHCQGPGHCFDLRQRRVNTKNLRGTGCAFASLVAASMALGYEVRDALIIARMALQDSIQNTRTVNGGRGCPRPAGFPRTHWPHYASDDLVTTFDQAFPTCVGNGQPDTLGLYPIVDRAVWLERLLPLGITTIQLRIKDLEGDALAQEVAHAVRIARTHRARLFINDYWQLAIDSGAYGVHLGQEDLATADLAAINRAGLRLGISNHCHYELVRALAVRPSYIAAGPVFATTTKDMPWVPHGLEGLSYWQGSITAYPLVAIAGINENNIEDIAATGVSGIALITAITQAKNPERVTVDLIQRIDISRTSSQRSPC